MIVQLEYGEEFMFGHNLESGNAREVVHIPGGNRKPFFQGHSPHKNIPNFDLPSSLLQIRENLSPGLRSRLR